MEVNAKLRYYRQSPRKVRLVANLVRGLDVKQAVDQLLFANKKASRAIRKLIESATANAKNNFSLNPDNLYIKTITVDQGPILKRWRARAFGRAAQIKKRTSHVQVILEEKKSITKTTDKKKAKTKPSTKKQKQNIKTVKSLKQVKDQAKKSEEQTKESKHSANKHKKGPKSFAPKIFNRKTG